MKHTRPIRSSVAALLFILVVATLMLGATSQDQGMAGMNHPGMNMSETGMGEMDMTSQLAGLEGEAFEAGFMSMMIAHHRGAVEMAQWIMERTENPELRAVAEAILAAQEPEIAQMTEWLEAWYGRSVDETMAEAMQQEMDMMTDAMAADGDPDAAFLRAMTAHHDSALDMAQLALTRATHDELRALARDIIVAQAEEIHAFQKQLADR